jgi:hypothetical protein
MIYAALRVVGYSSLFWFQVEDEETLEEISVDHYDEWLHLLPEEIDDPESEVELAQTASNRPADVTILNQVFV